MLSRVPQQKKVLLALSLCLCSGGGHQAMAQQIPGSVDPSRLGTGTQLPSVPAAQAPATETRSHDSGDIVIPGADQVTFVLDALVIEGMTAYPAGYFEQEYAGLRGRSVTLQQVIDVVNRINHIYRDDGYIFSRAFFPEQDITAGRVAVQIQEGNVRDVTLQTPDARHQELLEPFLHKIRLLRPFNIHNFEHWILTMNNLPGARIRSVLRQAGDGTPGGIDVVLLEDKEPGAGLIGIDNQGSRYAGPGQLSVSYDRPRIFSAYDQASIRLSSTIPYGEIRYGQIGYERPLMCVPGLSFTSQLGWGGTESGSDLDILDVKGYVRDLRVGLSYAAHLSRRSNWLLYLNFDMKNARSKISGDELYDDRLRVLRFSSAFQYVDDWQGVTLLSGEISKGLNIMGARETGSENLSRADGHSDFTKVSAQVSRLQALPRNLQLFGQLSSQYAFNPLLSAEEYGYGGVPSGRGYDPSELTGDHGFSATLELRYNGLQFQAPWAAQPYVFVDFGKVWDKGDAPANAISAISTGFGARVDYGDLTSANFVVALPLTYAAGNPPGYTNGEAPRFLFSLSRKF